MSMSGHPHGACTVHVLSDLDICLLCKGPSVQNCTCPLQRGIDLRCASEALPHHP